MIGNYQPATWQQMQQAPPDPFDPTQAAARAVPRAADALRRLSPVLLAGDTPHLVLPAERAWLLAPLAKRLGAPDLLISQQRAAILKIRHKGAAAVRLAGDQHCDADKIQAIIDAQRDLADPLKGPFQTRPSAEPDDAAIRLMKIAGLLPAALVWPGDALPANDLPVVAAPAVRAFDLDGRNALMPVAAANVPLAAAERCRLIAFRPALGGREHYALVIGRPDPSLPVLVRLHSECFTGDLLGSLKCDCGDQLTGAIAAIAEAGGGVLLYLAQEGRGIGLVSKLKAYALQDQGFDTVEANLRLGFEIDERLFDPAVQMLRHLGIATVRLLTNNPEKVAGLQAAGLTVTDRVAHRFPDNPHNAHYLATKRDKTGHYL